jgi:hypothetical protein
MEDRRREIFDYSDYNRKSKGTELSVPVNHELKKMLVMGRSIFSVVVLESQLPIGCLVNPC